MSEVFEKCFDSYDYWLRQAQPALLNSKLRWLSLSKPFELDLESQAKKYPHWEGILSIQS